MEDAFDLAVVGAGPAGIGACLSAAEHGLRTIVIDEAPLAGGQVYRAVPPDFAIRDRRRMGPDFAVGEGLRAALAASPVEKLLGARLWLVGPGFTLGALGPDGERRVQAKAVVAATGTSERIIPVPGSTTPGVIGLAAATILLKSQQMLPGSRTVVAGCGPLVAAVAIAILKGGGSVAALVDLSGPGDWARAMPALLSRPGLLARGLGWMARIKAAGVPVFFHHAVTQIAGDERVTSVSIRPVDGDRRLVVGAAPRDFEADSLAMGHGLVPATEVTRLLGARHGFVRDSGGWIAERDADMRSSVRRLYVAGDGGGIVGAGPSLLQGRLAGLTAAFDLGRLDEAAFRAAAAPLRQELGPAERFGRAMGRLMALQPGQLDSMAPETTVCRCEDLTRAELEDAIRQGARTVNQLKSWTRCGMGPCQGRMCSEAAAELVAQASSREAAGQWTARIPIRPVLLGELSGDFSYADIEAVAPEPQPL